MMKLSRDSQRDGLLLAQKMAHDLAETMQKGEIPSLYGPAALELLAKCIDDVIGES